MRHGAGDRDNHGSQIGLPAVTPEERFRFDLQGYVVVPGVLTRDECAELSALADRAWPRAPEDGPYRRLEAFSR